MRRVHANPYAHAESGVCICAHVPHWRARCLSSDTQHALRAHCSIGRVLLERAFTESFQLGHHARDLLAFLLLHCTLPWLIRSHVLSVQCFPTAQCSRDLIAFLSVALHASCVLYVQSSPTGQHPGWRGPTTRRPRAGRQTQPHVAATTTSTSPQVPSASVSSRQRRHTGRGTTLSASLCCLAGTRAYPIHIHL
jgi:hypothetical protein